MDLQVCRAIHADHPSLSGHFPGEPIVPGVVILDEIADALHQCYPDAHLAGIPVVKFLAPLRPDQQFTIVLSNSEEKSDEIAFSCTSEDRIIAEGRFQIVSL